MVELLIVLAGVACILYLILTAIVEAWASWGDDDSTSNEQPIEDSDTPPRSSQGWNLWRSVWDLAQTMLWRQGERQERYR